jgi:hypothetical protein
MRTMSSLGFHDAENYLYKAPKGLNREIVGKISGFKSEPRWMRDFRLKALDHLLARKRPTWGSPMLAELDAAAVPAYCRFPTGRARASRVRRRSAPSVSIEKSDERLSRHRPELLHWHGAAAVRRTCAHINQSHLERRRRPENPFPQSLQLADPSGVVGLADVRERGFWDVDVVAPDDPLCFSRRLVRGSRLDVRPFHRFREATSRRAPSAEPRTATSRTVSSPATEEPP